MIRLGIQGALHPVSEAASIAEIHVSLRRRVNAVETMYDSWPLFMTVDSSLGSLLLEPLLRFQSSSLYTNDYPAQDAGQCISRFYLIISVFRYWTIYVLTGEEYPIATTSNNSHSQGVEQGGNMICMAYALARTTGEASLVSQYVSISLLRMFIYLP